MSHTSPSYNNLGPRIALAGDFQSTNSAPLLKNYRNGVTYFVDPQNGSDAGGSATGKTWAKAFASFDALDDILDDGDTIYLSGVYKGNWDAPYKNDVSIIGMANTPRQATDGGVANGGGATWLSTDTPAAGHLLKINRQGWTVANIYFNNASTTSGDSCIQLYRDGLTPEADASHATILGCKFTGAEDGILGTNGPNFVTIRGCEFNGFAGTGDTAITLSTPSGQGTNSHWQIKDNAFLGNKNHISAGAAGAWHNAVITGNSFSWKQAGATTTVLQVDLGTIAVNCIVMGNYFQNAHAETGSGAMFLPQDTANSWLNFYRDGLVSLVPAT